MAGAESSTGDTATGRGIFCFRSLRIWEYVEKSLLRKAALAFCDWCKRISYFDAAATMALSIPEISKR
jgi:hypothetical protein